jgi:hypothetical protein
VLGLGAGGQAAAGAAPTLVEVLGTAHREWVIDAARMQGKGGPNAAIQVSHAGILRLLGQALVPFESAQIQRVMRIICRSLLDSSVALSQKNTLIYYLHELNTQYGRRQGSVPRAAQFEILACLVDLCRVLRTQLSTTLARIREQEAAALI